MSAAETQQIRDLVRAAQTKADAYTRAREAGLRAAWTELDTKSTDPCPVKLPKLPLIRGEDQPDADREAIDQAHWRMNVVTAGALLGEPPPSDEKSMQKIEREIATKGPRRDQFDRQSEMVLRIADSGHVPSSWKNAAEILALGTEIGSDAYWGWELDIVASEYTPPLFNPSGFAPGRIAGRALLWSFPEGRVVCAAPVAATNQDAMKLRFDPKQQQMQQHHTLNIDLKNQAYRAAIDALRAVPARSSPTLTIERVMSVGELVKLGDPKAPALAKLESALGKPTYVGSDGEGGVAHKWAVIDGARCAYCIVHTMGEKVDGIELPMTVVDEPMGNRIECRAIAKKSP